MYMNIKEAGIKLPFRLKTMAAGIAGWKAKELYDKVQFANSIQQQMGKQANVGEENTMNDLNFEYQAALNEANFAQYMYENAMNKVASIEKEAACGSVAAKAVKGAVKSVTNAAKALPGKVDMAGQRLISKGRIADDQLAQFAGNVLSNHQKALAGGIAAAGAAYGAKKAMDKKASIGSYSEYRQMNKLAKADLNNLVLARLQDNAAYREQLGMKPVSTKDIGRRYLANVAESAGGMAGAIPGAVALGVSAAAKNPKLRAAGLIGGGLASIAGGLYGGTAAHAAAARALGVANN